MSPSFELEAPDHFTAGAVGPPGERVFYFQAREQRRLVTLKCEKEMVRGLATYLQALLARLPKTTEAPPAETALLEPLDAAWAVGAIGVGWEQAVAFVERAESLMKAGRPVCRTCGRAKDPGGHVCPGENGHVVR
ncbi:MAG: DUF3090 family protein [Candidatus Rokubacteria bacterium]|nr:DUF3090 family protein [Candidatus Rokubacteria bacterium]